MLSMDARTSRRDFVGRATTGALLGVIVGTLVAGVVNVALEYLVMPLNQELREAGSLPPWMLFTFTAVFAGPSAAVSGAVGAASKRPAVGLVSGLVVALLVSVY